jgi:hypothetical protein
VVSRDNDDSGETKQTAKEKKDSGEPQGEWGTNAGGSSSDYED